MANDEKQSRLEHLRARLHIMEYALTLNVAGDVEYTACWCPRCETIQDMPHTRPGHPSEMSCPDCRTEMLFAHESVTVYFADLTVECASALMLNELRAVSGDPFASVYFSRDAGSWVCCSERGQVNSTEGELMAVASHLSDLVRQDSVEDADTVTRVARKLLDVLGNVKACA